MRLRLRAIIVLTLGAALWLIADGVKCVWTGSYFGRVVRHVTDADGAYGYVDGAGQMVQYGVWADLLTHLGLDVHDLAPMFIGVGMFGMVALLLFLQARVIGWAALCTFAVIVALRVWGLTPFGVGLLACLLWPGTLRAVIAAAGDPRQ